MTVLGDNDLLKVRFSGLVADYDRDTMVNLYQPIVGFTALAIYFSLWTLSNTNEEEYITHESLFNRMQIAPGRFVENRKLLEGTGLLKTYVRNSEVGKKYSYVLYAPKSPKDFFNNALLYGMLVKCIGIKEVNDIKAKYLVDNNDEVGEEISEKFTDVFKPNYDDPAFMFAANAKENAVGRNTAKIKDCFDYDIFFKNVDKNSEINEKTISSKEMKEIERLALLNGINEEKAAEYVEDIFDPNAIKGKRINFDLLSQLFQEEANILYVNNSERKTLAPNLMKGNSDLASKINLMEKVSPKDYLSILQNGTRPARSDLKLLDDLSKNFKLQNCVINAIVDFALASNNNILSTSYCEKIAGSLAREGVLTTIDAMNYLKRVTKKKRKEETQNKKMVQVTKVKEENNEEDSVSWNQLLDEIDEEDDANGKA